MSDRRLMAHDRRHHRAPRRAAGSRRVPATSGPTGCRYPARPRSRAWSPGVTAQRELIERAVRAGAELVLVHHGLFWNFHPTGLTPLLAERLRPLFKHDIDLAAYHLPLDAHPEVGNNALLARALGLRGARAVRRLQGHADRPPRALRRAAGAVAELHARVRAVTGRDAARLRRRAGARSRSIGIVSGSAADTLDEAVAARPRRVPDRRAARAHHGRRARGRDPLHRRRPLRDGDLRRPGARRTAGATDSASSTSSSTCPNPV